jgi:hypothetical protein
VSVLSMVSLLRCVINCAFVHAIWQSAMLVRRPSRHPCRVLAGVLVR